MPDPIQEPAPPPTEPPPTTPPAADPPLTPTAVFDKLGSWQALIPQDLVVDYQGKQVPAKDHPFFKEPKTFGDFLKSGFEYHKAFGERVKIPGKDAKPEEKDAFLQKVREAELIPAPKPIPEAPDKYEIKPPEGMGELDKTQVDKVRAILHEEGVSQAGAEKLMGVYFEAHKDVIPVLKEVQELIPQLKIVKEDALKEFEDEMRGNGQEPERVKATIGRYLAKKFSPEQLASLGDYGNHPLVMRVLYDSAMAAREDFGPVKINTEPIIYDEDAANELREIHTPGTEKNALWQSRTPAGEQMREHAIKLQQKVTGGR